MHTPISPESVVMSSKIACTPMHEIFSILQPICYPEKRHARSNGNLLSLSFNAFASSCCCACIHTWIGNGARERIWCQHRDLRRPDSLEVNKRENDLGSSSGSSGLESQSSTNMLESQPSRGTIKDLQSHPLNLVSGLRNIPPRPPEPPDSRHSTLEGAQSYEESDIESHITSPRWVLKKFLLIPKIYSMKRLVRQLSTVVWQFTPLQL